MGLFDIFKDKDDDEGGMAEYENEDNTSRFSSEPEPSERHTEGGDETSSVDSVEPTSYAQPATDLGSQLGIQELMNKRFKLEEAIDYVGVMIKNLKGKRTKLVKNIEDEIVDITNLKEKLTKINEYIEEENRGLEELKNKRAQVDRDADEVGSIVYNLRDKISDIDKIVADEAGRIKSFKDSKSSSN